MSYVTNVMVSAVDNVKNIEAMQKIAIASSARDQTFVNIADGDAGGLWGGTKYPECDLWAAAFNFINLKELLNGIGNISWEDPEDVQVFVKDQEDYKWKLFSLEECREY